MKKHLIFVLLAALIILPGSSVWEGSAAVSSDFPESGLYAATNSFPRNTVVDLTNLETGKTIRVIVTAGLDTPGLLAQVSREAAEAIGLRSRAIGRIRMVVPSDPIALSQFSGDYRSGDPDFDPVAAVNRVYGKDVPAAENIGSDEPWRSMPENVWAGAEDIPAATVPILKDGPETVVDTPSVVPSEPYPAYNYTLIPSEERPPQYIPSTESPPVQNTTPAVHNFSVPVITNLESGKYYLQLGTYSHAATVENELSKIGKGFSTRVQNIGSSGQPLYRILIGPSTQGESATLLKNFKAKGYNDAFVRRG